MHHLSGRYSAHSHFRYDTLYVADAVQMLVDGLTEVGLAEKRFHHVETLVDGRHVAQRKYRPAAQQSAAHRCAGAVDDGEQRHAVVLHRLQQLQRVDCKAVETHIAVGIDARKRRDVSNLCVLRHLQILQYGSCRRHAEVQMVYAEALQRCGAKVGEQFLSRALLGEHPVVELEDTPLGAETLLKLALQLSVVQHFLRLYAAQKFLYVVERALTREELARRDVEERHAARRLSHAHRCQKVVLLIVEHGVVHRHARRNQLRNATLHECLRELRVLQLVAYSHTLTGTYQLRQIGVERMIREASHLARCRARVLTVGASCQRDAENLCCLHSVVGVCLVEVATTEEQQCVWMFFFERIELSHHRR